MPPVPRLRKGVRKIISEGESLVAKGYRESVRELRKSIDFQALVKAIADKNVDRALEALDIEDAAYAPLRAALARTFEAGGKYSAKTLPRPTRRF